MSTQLRSIFIFLLGIFFILPLYLGCAEEECTNECTKLDTKQCSGNGYQVCGNYDDDECLEWSGVTNCGEGESCSNGVCSIICTDECTSEGSKQCSGDGYQVCGNYDDDECLEWDDVVCGNYDDDECLDWGSDVTACYAYQTCTNGECFEREKNRAFVVTTDYYTGSFSTIDIATQTATKDIAPIHSDAVAVYRKGKVYVVNRLGQDNITVLDPMDNFNVLKQFSTGNGSNPYDIEFLSDIKAYVSRYGINSILRVNPEDGIEIGTIDLSSLADDNDSIPEMAYMLLKDDELYVAIQRLDRNAWFAPTGISYLAVVDTNTDTLEKTITLTGTNPIEDLVYNEATDGILVAEVGSYGAQDGGIEKINTSTNTAEGFIITEETLGGDIGPFVIASETKGYVIVTDSSFNTTLKSFNPKDGTLLETIYSTVGFALTCLALNDQGELYVCDRTETNPGIRIYNTADDSEIITTPIDVGLPPNGVIFIP